MTALAVIPARGGSKGVPGKNLALVGGVPLVGRAIRAALASGSVDTVAVSTDDDGIAAVAAAAGARVIRRPAELATDTASSESALLHALDAVEGLGGPAVDVLVMVQCTSPFVTGGEIAACVAAVRAGADTAFTAAPSHGFLWQASGGDAVGINHDKASRPRRQDRAAEYLETGAVYAMATAGFRRSGHRFFGTTAVVQTDPRRVLEIDEPADLERARALASLFDPPAERPGRDDLDAVVLDFDGTQTDDSVLVSADGGEQVRVHRGDGLAIAALRRSGLPVLTLSSETNPVVRARARKLGVPVIHGVDDKGTVLRDWCAAQGVDPARVLYAGNDVNDLGCFAVAGWPVAVASAHPVLRNAARLVTTVPGGHGAIREIASWILGKELS